MDTITLEAQKRDASQHAKLTRRESRVPAAYYGKGIENMNIDLDYQDFRRAFEKGGYNTVLDIKVDGKAYKALVQEIQMDPVTDLFTHVDFIAVDMNKEVSTQIPLVFVGTSNAVKEMGGTLMENRTEVNVKCLAKDLIHEIEVDLSILEDFNSVIHISDLNVPSTVEITDEPELTVATVAAPKSEEEIEAEEAESAAAAEAALDAVKDEGSEGEDGEGKGGDESKEEAGE